MKQWAEFVNDMPESDVTQVKIGKGSVGILGLKKTLQDMVATHADVPYDEVKEELLKRLKKQNYIPDRVSEEYGMAFLREFKKFLGRPHDEGPKEGIEILVLGPGCPQCDGLEQALMTAMGELHLSASIEHVRDIKEIGKYGVMGTPALLINGKLMSVGRIPPKTRLLEWLKEAQVDTPGQRGAIGL